jgi:hypothetical protein
VLIDKTVTQLKMSTTPDGNTCDISDACVLDNIETMFRSKIMRDAREEVVVYAAKKNSSDYVDIYDAVQKYFNTPPLHSRKRLMIIETFRSYFDETSEKHVLISDELRLHMEAIVKRLEADERSTTVEENDQVVRMMEKIVVGKLMNMFSDYTIQDVKINGDQYKTRSLKRTQSNLNQRWGSFRSSLTELKKKTSLQTFMSFKK